MKGYKGEYERVLKDVYGESYETVEKLKSKRRSPFAARTGSSRRDVFGVVRIITALKATPFCASMKEIIMNDPTDESGLMVTVKGKTELLLPGNIVKLSDVKSVTESNGRINFMVESSNLVQYHCFKYDYQEHSTMDSSSFLSHPFEENERDEGICEVLEKWISSDILRKRFSQLQQVAGRMYIDFIGQIIEQRMMRGSVVLTLWDGSDPGTSTEDPYKSEYSYTYTQYGNNYSVRTNDPVKSSVPMNKYVFVNVWRNPSNSANEHFDKCAHSQLKDGDDLLLMFNVEVSPNKHGFGYPIQLNMRSGHHQGKGVRSVKPHSILGRSFLHILQTERAKFTLQGDISDGDITEDDMAGNLVPREGVDNVQKERVDNVQKERVDSVQMARVDRTGEDRVFETETSRDFQSIPGLMASTPNSPSRKKPRIFESPVRVSNLDFGTRTDEPEPVPGPSRAVRTPTKVPVAKETVAKETVISVDLNDPDIRSLLTKLPPHIPFNTLVGMDPDELTEYEQLLLDADDWVEADVRDFGPNLTKHSLIQILRLAKTVKGCSPGGV